MQQAWIILHIIPFPNISLAIASHTSIISTCTSIISNLPTLPFFLIQTTFTPLYLHNYLLVLCWQFLYPISNIRLSTLVHSQNDRFVVPYKLIDLLFPTPQSRFMGLINSNTTFFFSQTRIQNCLGYLIRD